VDVLTIKKTNPIKSTLTTQVYAKIVNADLDKAMDIFDEKPTKSTEKK
jgi:hypothetical protein